MNKFLIAAGAGALLVVAQTAVSAAYNPLDRVGTPVGEAAVAPVAPAEKSMTRPAVTFDAPYGPVDLAVGDSIFGSEEITAPSPRREIPVTDRVSGTTGRYNLALDAVSQTQTCTKTMGFKGKTIPTSSDFSYKCVDKSIGYPPSTPFFIGGIALASATVLADGGETD